MAALQDGGYVVAWITKEGPSHQSGPSEIHFQRYGANGEKIGPERRADTGVWNSPFDLDVAALPDGGFVIAFGAPDGGGSGVIMRRFNLAGLPTGDEVRVTENFDPSQDDPQVAVLADGSTVIVWKAFGQDGSSLSIHGQIYDAQGAAVGGEFQVNTTVEGSQSNPSIAALKDGGFVVTFTSPDADDDGLFGQRYDAAGTRVGGEFQINTVTAGAQRPGAVAALDGGGFVALWQSNEIGTGELFAQRFNSAGAKVGGPILVSDGQSGASQPEIFALADGGFVAVWRDDLRATFRRFDANGEAIGEPMPMTNPGGNAHSRPTGVGLADGSFLIGWGGSDGNFADDIYFNRFRDSGEFLTEGADVAMGTSLGDYIWGFGGNDELHGGGGDDSLEGGEGADRLVGGSGRDEASYAGAMAAVSINLQGGGHGGDAAGDTFESIEDFRLSRFADRFLGASVDETVYGEGGDDLLLGFGGADTLDGGDGNDVLEGGAGADTLAGGDGTDEASYARALAAVSLNLATGRHGGDAAGDIFSSIEKFTLSRFNDSFIGSAGADIVFGGFGNDMLDGGAGADRLTGGAGDDTYVVDSLEDLVIEYAGGGNDTVRTAMNYTLGAEVERLVLPGNAAVNGTGNALANAITGNGNHNILDGGLGDDALNGGAGNDIYIVDSAGDSVIEGLNGGNDTVMSSVTYWLSNAYEVENLILTGDAAINGTGNKFANSLTGNAAANRLNGGAGADRMSGGDGNDTYIVDDLGDRVYEASATGGYDTVISSVSFFLAGIAVEALQLSGTDAINGTGNSANNSLVGNGAANVLSGLGGADSIDGGAGDDRISGGAGHDTLRGGGGADGFVFDSALSAAANVDQILDFSVADDTIYLSRTVFTALGANGELPAGAFVSGTAATDADDRILYDQATGRIFYDADGSDAGAAILFAQVSAGTALTAADFAVFTV
ncbi:MAG: hypothetical protein ACK40O_10540 [Allosphingosinicella sp.]